MRDTKDIKTLGRANDWGHKQHKNVHDNTVTTQTITLDAPKLEHSHYPKCETKASADQSLRRLYICVRVPAKGNIFKAICVP